jgi:ribosome modulation factor
MKRQGRAKAERAFNKATAGEPQAKPAGPRIVTELKSNGPRPVDLRHHYEQIEAAKAAAQSKAAEHQAKRKMAKECGINLNAISLIQKFQKMDEDDRASTFKQMAALNEVMNKGIQFDLFGATGQLSRKAEIFDEGYKAGLAAKSQSDSAYDANTTHGQIWLQGWHIGQAENIEALTKGAAPAAAESSGSDAGDEHPDPDAQNVWPDDEQIAAQKTNGHDAQAEAAA